MLALSNAVCREEIGSGKCEFLSADFNHFKTDEKFDFVVALGVFDYVDQPAELLRKMAGWSRDKVIASFPMGSLVRAPLRKARYTLRGCPVHFYTPQRLAAMAHSAGLTGYSIDDIGSSGRLLVATTGLAAYRERDVASSTANAD
jgi:hypothetical protein